MRIERASRSLCVLGALCAGLLLSSGFLDGAAPRARASVVQALSLEELTRNADLVIVAVPTEQHSRLDLDGKMIVTDVNLRVDEVLKGPVKRASNVVATLLGGRLDQLALQVPGEANFVSGMRVVVFLHRSQGGDDLRVVGMSQGVLPLVQQGGRTIAKPGGAGAALVDRGGDGVLRDAPSALMRPLPAAELLERIRSIVRAQRH